MHAPPTRIPVALFGATGSVGQRFVLLLERHPWFELVHVCASAESSGRRYGDAVRWIQAEPIPARIASMKLERCDPRVECPLVFSALDASAAESLERAAALAGRFVVSNAKSHRMHPSVPLLVPEVNPESLDLLSGQPFGPGAIVTNPNCSTLGLVLALKPLADRFGVARVHVVTLQALSGAGLDGPTGYAASGNVIPFIADEEEKLASETRKILGEVEVSAACNRVPVVDGHTLCVSVELERPAQLADLRDAWEGFRGTPQELALPSAPARPTIFLDGPDSPQPRLHLELEKGMATVIGRLRPCPLFGWKFVALTHNTLRGAAGGAILAAELALADGRFAAA